MKLLKLTCILIPTALLTVACASPDDPASQDAASTEFGDDFEDDDKLAVEVQDSPSGTAQFDFCLNTDPAAPVNLHNASWMAYMAANEYAHLGYLAPALLELGFGTDGDLFWRSCGVALRQVRAWEIANADELATAYQQGPDMMQKLVAWQVHPSNPDAWDVCAREFVEQTAYDGTTYPAAGMEAWLIQTTDPDSYLQFFSGGAVVGTGAAFEGGSTQAFYARHASLPMAVFSFRGTEPDKLEDIAADAQAWDVTLDIQEGGWSKGWGEVHAGFHEAFNSLLTQFDAQLAQVEGNGVGIWVTGHSLGGALGTLMTARILDHMEQGRDFNLRGFYSFGSPRVGDDDFQERFDALAAKYGVKVGRVRNDNDIVTHVPGSTFNFNGWSHVGTRVYMTPDSLSFPAEQPDYDGLLGLGSAADHSMVASAEDGTPTGYYDRLLAFSRQAPHAGLSACMP